MVFRFFLAEKTTTDTTGASVGKGETEGSSAWVNEQQQGTEQQQRNASQPQGQQSSVFLTEQQMQVLAQELGFDEQVINQGQQVLYASLSQRDLMPDGVTIYSGGSIDLEVTNDIQLHAGIGAADELWLSTQGNLDLGNQKIGSGLAPCPDFKG